MRSLFFLGGASLVSGLEARLRFGIARDDAVVLATPRIADALDPSEWRAQRVLNTKPRGAHRLLHAVTTTAALVEFIARHGPFSDVFLADLTTAMRLTALLASPARVTVLDDGLFAPSTGAERQQQPQTVAERVLDPRHVRFFSAFAVSGRATDATVVNDYRCLRERAASLPANGEDWIVGQPLVESQIMDLAVVQDIVHRVAATLRNPVYICHPSERDDVVRLVVDGLPVRRFRLPLEIEMARSDARPNSLVGFYSSGLVQPMLMMGDTISVTAFRIPPDLVLRAQAPIARAYAALETLCEQHDSFQLADLPGKR